MFEPFFLRMPAICLVALLVPAVCGAAQPTPSDGNAKLRDTHWAVQTLDGVPLAPAEQRPEVHLVLHTGSQHLSGFAGCNRIRGRYAQHGTQLALSAPGSTRMACPAVQMQQEQQLIALLGAVDAYRIEGKVLSLLQGEVVRVTFNATTAKVSAQK